MFKDNMTYEIFESDTIRISGEWKFSESGKQIVLNRGSTPEDYIDLLFIKNDTISIGKVDMFHLGTKPNHITDYYYKIVLVKDNSY